MGTNFYWIGKTHEDGEDDPSVHIGKRSAAGLYCWDCGTTLCSDGTERIHYGRVDFFKTCPNCNKSPNDGKTTGHVELGFAEPKDVGRKGVTSCCSFIWTMMKHKRDLKYLFNVNKKVVIDEYNREYTAKEFFEEALAGVAIEFQSYRNFC